MKGQQPDLRAATKNCSCCRSVHPGPRGARPPYAAFHRRPWKQKRVTAVASLTCSVGGLDRVRAKQLPTRMGFLTTKLYRQECCSDYAGRKIAMTVWRTGAWRLQIVNRSNRVLPLREMLAESGEPPQCAGCPPHPPNLIWAPSGRHRQAGPQEHHP